MIAKLNPVYNACNRPGRAEKYEIGIVQSIGLCVYYSNWTIIGVGQYNKETIKYAYTN